MHAGGPAVPQLLLHGAACKVQPRSIDKRAELVRTGDPDHHRSRVGHVAEALFAFPQLGFSLLSFADVLPRADHVYSSAILEKYLPGCGDPSLASIGTADHTVLRVVFAVSRRIERALQESLRLGPVLRMQSREEGVDGNWRVGSDTPELPHACVPQDGSGCDVIVVDTQLGRILGDPEPLLPLADGLLVTPALGDVADNSPHACRLARFVPEKVRPQLYREYAPVTPSIFLLVHR